ncbi:unnamed protein product [Rotaria sp. Silwood2]|nr:unnamed protein product [Rotaria sp. Silwood2]
MNRTHVHLLDLSDQILLTILKKLENIDVLYSLLDINNERLDNLAQNTIFTNTLNFLLISSTDHISSINLQILDRLCNYVLPRIYSNVKCLIVEPLSMERILLASSHYSNLTELKLFNFERRTALHYFTGNHLAFFF